MNAINQQIDQTLSKLNSKPGTGGVVDTTALLNNSSVLSPSAPDPTPPTDMALGFVQITSPTWSTIDVYQSQNISGKTVGMMKYGNVYPYLQKISNWYQVRISTTATGWVLAALVSETDGL